MQIHNKYANPISMSLTLFSQFQKKIKIQSEFQMLRKSGQKKKKYSIHFPNYRVFEGCVRHDEKKLKKLMEKKNGRRLR